MEEPFQIQYPKEQSRDESLAVTGILVLEELKLIEKCSRIFKKCLLGILNSGNPAVI